MLAIVDVARQVQTILQRYRNCRILSILDVDELVKMTR